MLHARVRMVTRRLRPPSPAARRHPPDRPIAGTGSGAPSRQRRGLGRRHHDPRPARTGRTIERERVVGRIRRHSGEVSIHLVDQPDPRHRVLGRRLSQRAGPDHTGPVHAEMELPPAASPSAPMCRRGPLTVADDGQSGAVTDEGPAGARAGAPTREGEMLTASRERGVIGGREIDAQYPEDRGHDALGLTQRYVEEETERQGGCDGEIGRLELPAPPADARRCPRGDRVRREPEGDVASPHEGSVVLGPVPDARRCRVRRMHSRLHIEIMTRRRSRWATCRPLLAHRAESAHQRPTPWSRPVPPAARWDVALRLSVSSVIHDRPSTPRSSSWTVRPG